MNSPWEAVNHRAAPVTSEQRRRATVYTARRVRNSAELAVLLDMLGLTPPHPRRTP